MIETKLDSQVILDAGRALGLPVDPATSTELMLVPNGYVVLATERLVAPYLPAPRRIRACVSLHTAGSFIRYVREFKLPETRIFAQLEPPLFTAVLDYHDGTTAQAAWCEHRARYQPSHTHEWERWVAMNGKHMGQVEFAAFLEENQTIITDPPGADLLEMVQTLEGHNGIRCNSLVRLSNGRSQLHYEEDVVLKGAGSSTKPGMIEFPQSITVTVPPFEGGPAYKIACRLRYRIPNRNLEFWFDAVDVHRVIADAVRQIVDEVNGKLEIEPLMGEAPASNQV